MSDMLARNARLACIAEVMLAALSGPEYIPVERVMAFVAMRFPSASHQDLDDAMEIAIELADDAIATGLRKVKPAGSA